MATEPMEKINSEEKENYTIIAEEIFNLCCGRLEHIEMLFVLTYTLARISAALVDEKRIHTGWEELRQMFDREFAAALADEAELVGPTNPTRAALIMSNLRPLS